MAIISNYVNLISTGVTRLEPNALSDVILKTVLIALGVGLITQSFVLSAVAAVISFSCLVFSKMPPDPPPSIHQRAPIQVRRSQTVLRKSSDDAFMKALTFFGQHQNKTVEEMNQYLRQIRKLDPKTADQVEEALKEMRKHINNPLVPKNLRKFINNLSTEGFLARTARKLKNAFD